MLKLEHSIPSRLEEISGIEMSSGSDLIWAIEDSGNKAVVYGYNPQSNSIDKEIEIENAENEDWEDLAMDENGNLYVGDFGNNRNKRDDLVIYAIGNPSLLGEEVTAVKTHFSFEDQKKFPPKKKERNFDVEAFICKGGYFYLFTRNRSSKFDGTTKLYRLPAVEGTFEAELIDTFVTCDDRRDCQVTGATINFETNTIALLSYNKVWLLSEYNDDNFFEGKIEKLKLGHRSQKESICFINSDSIYIADENRGIDGGNLYLLSNF